MTHFDEYRKRPTNDFHNCYKMSNFVAETENINNEKSITVSRSSASCSWKSTG